MLLFTIVWHRKIRAAADHPDFRNCALFDSLIDTLLSPSILIHSYTIAVDRWDVLSSTSSSVLRGSKRTFLSIQYPSFLYTKIQVKGVNRFGFQCVPRHSCSLSPKPGEMIPANAIPLSEESVIPSSNPTNRCPVSLKLYLFSLLTQSYLNYHQLCWQDTVSI